MVLGREFSGGGGEGEVGRSGAGRLECFVGERRVWSAEGRRADVRKGATEGLTSRRIAVVTATRPQRAFLWFVQQFGERANCEGVWVQRVS